MATSARTRSPRQPRPRGQRTEHPGNGPDSKARRQLAKSLAFAFEADFLAHGALDHARVAARLSPVERSAWLACSPDEQAAVLSDVAAISALRPATVERRRAVLMRRRLHAVLGEAHALLGFASSKLLEGYPEEEKPARKADLDAWRDQIMSLKCSVLDDNVPPAPDQKATVAGHPAFVSASIQSALEARLEGAPEEIALAAAGLDAGLLAVRRNRGKVCSRCGAVGEVGEHGEHRGAIVCADCYDAASECEVCRVDRGEVHTVAGRQMCSWCYIFDDVLLETPPPRSPR